eukprot:7728918-Pyramimonas_sp.AAC.1
MVIRACVHRGVPIACENPLSSYAWQETVMRQLSARPRCRDAIFDMCQFGAAWRNQLDYGPGTV